jgi:hypothetical protein
MAVFSFRGDPMKKAGAAEKLKVQTVKELEQRLAVVVEMQRRLGINRGEGRRIHQGARAEDSRNRRAGRSVHQATTP